MIQTFKRAYAEHVRTDGRFRATVNAILIIPILALALTLDFWSLLCSQKGACSTLDTLFKCKGCGRLTWHKNAYWYPKSTPFFENFNRYFEHSFPYCPRCAEPLQFLEAVRNG